MILYAKDEWNVFEDNKHMKYYQQNFVIGIFGNF